LAYLQVVKGDYFSELSHRNRIRILTLTAPRGNIYDRYGQLLAATRPAFAVSIMEMGSKEDLNKSIAGLARLLDMSEDSIRDRIRKHQRPFEPVRIATDISPVVHTLIVENRDNLPGVIIETLPIRDYVYDSLAAHLFGYVSEISAKELADPNWDGRRQGDIIGKTGLERRYDRELRGVDGGQQVEVDVAGHLVEVLGEIPPVNGANLVLTIDAELQRVAEDFFDQWTQRVRTGQGLAQAYPDANRGAVVVMKVDTGEILAMFSKPDFDPNLFAAGIDVQTYRDLTNDPHKPFLDRVLQARYPPGSTFKMVTGTAVLEEGLFRERDIITCPGVITLYNDTKSCYRNHAHGPVNFFDALAVSCNIYFYQAGLEAGIDKIAHYAREYGFGSPAGLTDLPFEKGGIVASREYKAVATRGEAWYPGDTMSAAIGQSYNSFTPLQLANYAAIIANGGIHYRPYLVQQVVDSQGRTVKETVPEAIRRAQVSDRTLALVRQAMRRVAQPGGTAWYRFSRLPVAVAGKTGSAQVDVIERGIPSHSLFTGYAPYEKPEIVVAVIFEHGGMGESSAVPAAAEIMEYYFTGTIEGVMDTNARSAAD